jgi:hypothetical protein
MSESDAPTDRPITVDVTYAVRVVMGTPSTPEIIKALSRAMHLCAVDSVSIVDMTATKATLIGESEET